MNVFNADELYFVGSEDSRNRGVRHLEFVCSAFFSRQLQCTDSSSENLIVRGYGLFDSTYSFVYGKC